MTARRRAILFNSIGIGGIVLFILCLFLIRRPPLASSDNATANDVPVVDANSGATVPADPNPAAPAGGNNEAVAHVLASHVALQKALDSLHRATTNNKGGFVEKAIADVERGLQHSADGLNYLMAHSDAAATAPARDAVGAPKFDAPANTKGKNPRMDDALVALKTAFDELQSAGGGDLGGARDKAIFEISQAASDVIAGIDFARNPAGARANVPVARATLDPEVTFVDLGTPAAKTGTISGTVVDAAGKPVAKVAIAYHSSTELRDRAVASYTSPVPGSGFAAAVAKLTDAQRQAAIDSQARIYAGRGYMGGTSAGITDAQGGFTITGLAPDQYIITAALPGRSGSQQPIEVKAGNQTKLINPLQLLAMARGGGGGN